MNYNYTFKKKFILLGYRLNSYEKDGKTVEQYILDIAYEYDKYMGLHVGQAYIKTENIGDLVLSDYFEDFIFDATCSYNKKYKRLYIEKIDSVTDTRGK